MIRNPYAKKKTSQAAAPADPRSSTSTKGSSASSSSLPVLPPNHRPVSFTQAFGEQQSEERHEKDPSEQHRPAANQKNGKDISDKDHHVLVGSQPHVLHVSPRQKGNPVLNSIRNVPWSYQPMVPDYMFSSTTCALFLSIKYHLLHPHYITERMAELQFRCQILLLLVDTEDNEAVLLQLNQLCVKHHFTLILAWSEAEAARYLESYKALDGKDAATFLQKKTANGFTDQASDILTSVKGVNKTDATSLMSQMDSLQQIMTAAPDELGLVHGLGQVKVQRLYDTFHKPFSKKAAKKRREERLEMYRVNQQEKELDRVEEQELANAED